MSEITIADAMRLAINLLRDSAESRKMPSGEPLGDDGTAVHAAAADELSALLSRRPGERDVAFPVELDPSFIRVSMDMWRKATDMQIPLHDAFKIHFMERRKSLLEGFEKTGKAWLAMLRGMKPTSNASELVALRTDIEEFVRWAEDGLETLARLGSGHDA